MMKTIYNSWLVQRFWDYAGAVSIRVKVLGIVLGVIILLGTFVILQMRAVLTSALLHELEHQGHALALGTVEQAMLLLETDDLETLNFLLEERKAHYSSESHNTIVDYVFVQDADGDLVAGESPATSQTHTLEFTTPIPEMPYAVVLGLSLVPIDTTVHDVTFQLLSITLVMVAVGLAAAFFLTWVLTRPILYLVDATHAVAQGHYDRRVPRWANDELGDLATAFNSMIEALGRAEEERRERERLREQYINGVIAAQENERQRIARELHDGTSQSLTSLLVGLQNLKQARNEEEMRCRADELRDVVSKTLAEVHNIAWELRPSVLDDLGLVSALEHYVEDYRKRYDLAVVLVVTGLDGRLPSDLETTIYRIVQEGLTNVARHAKASSVNVILNQRGDHLRVIIEDDGRGFDLESVQHRAKSLGLKGIRERTALLGGSLSIESRPGKGTTLFIEVPAPPVNEPVRAYE